MAEENITYARGRVVELNSEIEALQIQIKSIKKSICSLACSENDIEVKEIKAILDDYETKRIKIHEAFKALHAIQNKWGFK